MDGTWFFYGIALAAVIYLVARYIERKEDAEKLERIQRRIKRREERQAGESEEEN